MMNKVLSGIVVLVLMVTAGAVGFYYGGKASPVSIGLSTLADIVYDEQAEARFNARIEVLDARLAEKEMALAELEQKNQGLERRVVNNRESYYDQVDEQSLVALDNQEKFESISADLEVALEGNKTAQNSLLKLENLFASEKNLFENQLVEANSYIITLEEANAGLESENTITKSINKALMDQNQVMRERIDDISGARLRHGPGYAVGLNPADNYQLTMLVGWTISWG